MSGRAPSPRTGSCGRARTFLRLACLSVVAVLLVLVVLPLQPTARAGPEPPSALATAYNTQRKLVRAGDGTLYAAVAVNASGHPEARVLSTRDGASWTPLPPPTTGNASDRTAVAVDSRGRLHLAWTELTPGDRQVFYARFQDGAWTPAEQLSSSPAYAGFPAIAVDASDRAHTVWYGFDGAFYQIYYRRLDPTGWTPERALTNEAVDATNPSIALGPEGHVHVVWFRLNRNATWNEIAYLRLEGDTVAELRPISAAGVDSTDPSIAVGPDGRVHVVWSARPGGVDRIEHAERAGTWSAPEAVSPTAVGAMHPSLALDGSARLRVVWESVGGGIFAQVRDGAWSAPTLVSTPSGNRYPSLRWSQDHNPLCGGNAVVDAVWTHQEAGVLSLAYRGIEAPADCPAPSPSPWPWVLGASILGIAVLAVAALVWRRRRWYPKPPAGPP